MNYSIELEINEDFIDAEVLDSGVKLRISVYRGGEIETAEIELSPERARKFVQELATIMRMKEEEWRAAE